MEETLEELLARAELAKEVVIAAGLYGAAAVIRDLVLKVKRLNPYTHPEDLPPPAPFTMDDLS